MVSQEVQARGWLVRQVLQGKLQRKVTAYVYVSVTVERVSSVYTERLMVLLFSCV